MKISCTMSKSDVTKIGRCLNKFKIKLHSNKFQFRSKFIVNANKYTLHNIHKVFQIVLSILLLHQNKPLLMKLFNLMQI